MDYVILLFVVGLAFLTILLAKTVNKRATTLFEFATGRLKEIVEELRLANNDIKDLRESIDEEKKIIDRIINESRSEKDRRSEERRSNDRRQHDRRSDDRRSNKNNRNRRDSDSQESN